MNEHDLRKLLHDTATDPGPRDSWPSFLRMARRRRQVRMAALGGALATLLLVAAGAIVVARDGVLRDDPNPAATEDAERDASPDEDVRETDDGRRIQEIPLIPGPGREPRRDGPVRGPNVDVGLDNAVDVLDDPGPGRRRGRGEPPDPPATTTGKCAGRVATVAGTNGADRLTGTAGADVIAAGGGADVVDGGGGDDYVCGGAGDDDLAGGGGADTLAGGAGDDGLAGGAGFDFIVFTDSPAGVEVDLRDHSAKGEGSDSVTEVEGVVGSPHGDRLDGSPTGDVLAGEDGVDLIDGNGGEDVVLPGPGDDLAAGGVGRDTIAFVAANWSPGERGVQVDLRSGEVLGEGNDEIIGFERANGTFGDDVLSGHSGPTVFRGYAGDDTLSGLTGNDDLFGGPGRDTLDGGLDLDLLDGGDGFDTCTTGEETSNCEAGTIGGLVFGGLGTAVLAAWRRRRRA